MAGHTPIPESLSTATVQAGYKRWFDLSVLLIAHLALFPVWILLWTVIPLMIWLEDRRSVFYRQQRMGKDGVPFNVIKFRTMVVDAESQGPAWTTEDDPRITRVGRILRRTALDELPELISILSGQMSFVGPRALGVDEQNFFEDLIPGFDQRLKVRPGLTGLAQIYDKNDNPHEKYRYDMEYLRELSPFLDARLLLLSVRNTLVGRWDHRSGKINLAEHKSRKSDSHFEMADRTEPTIPDPENSHP